MKVYDLGNTQWKQLTPTSSQQTNIDAAGCKRIQYKCGCWSNCSNINAVAGDLT